jgi:hypothetical protein
MTEEELDEEERKYINDIENGFNSTNVVDEY